MTHTNSPPDPLQLVGVTIDGKYRIDACVAEGGFALVYKATHLVWNRAVAVKAFRALADLHESQREKLVEEFIREGALLAELSERSAAIVQARDVGTVTTKKGEHVPYMILEWLDGSTLDAVLEEDRRTGAPPRTLAQTIALLDPVAEALALAHRKGIAHRDVKPGNIFILGDPRSDQFNVKLLDFGIAKVVQDAQKLSGSFEKTSGNVTSFTPAYGAPEQFSRTHGATGPWTDVFALALVAVEVLSGRAPIEGDTFVQLGYASSDRNRRPTPRTLGAQIPDAVEEVFAKALAVTPEERFQSAGDFWNALRTAASMAPMRALTDPQPRTSFSAIASAPTALAPQPSESTMAKTTDPVRRSGLPIVPIASGLAVIAALGAGGYFAFANKTPRTPAAASASATMSSASVAAPAEKKCPEGSVAIPAAKFHMGLDDPPPGKPYPPYLESALPAHQVTLSAYCMDVYEVTVEQYKKCSDSGGCKRASAENHIDGLTPIQKKAYDPLCNINEPSARAKHPINCVDWEQASEYCREHGGRLPTEAEWEFAALGPDGRLYPWGDDPPGKGLLNGCGRECMAWAKKNNVDADFPSMMYDYDDGWETTAPVGSFPDGKSRYGIEDIVGNVWEWTADYFGDYTKQAETDPTGPSKGTERVIRGGAWNAAFVDWARPQFRYHAAASQRSYGVGFRCAYTPK
jgi:formylglycine-generating enzyme required for sulfatase activity